MMLSINPLYRKILKRPVELVGVHLAKEDRKKILHFEIMYWTRDLFLSLNVNLFQNCAYIQSVKSYYLYYAIGLLHMFSPYPY